MAEVQITIPVDDALWERARERAQAMGASLEQLVLDYLERLGAAEQAERDET